MISPRRLLFVLPLLAALCLSSGGARAQNTQDIVLHEPSGTMVRVRHVFSEIPASGATAVQITVVNRLNEPLRVDVSSFCENHQAGGAVTGTGLSVNAPASSTVTREWTAPLTATDGTWRNLRVNVSSSLRDSAAQFSSESMEGLPFVAFSAGLAGHGIAVLQQEFVNRFNSALAASSAKHSSHVYRSGEKFAARYEPGDLPADWRALSGLDALAITADEWLKLPEPARLAARQYVFMGGQLDLYHDGPAVEGILNSFGLKPEAVASGAVVRLNAGAGAVRSLPWDGQELKADAVAWYEPSAKIPVRSKELFEALIRRERVAPGEKPLANLQDLLGDKSFAAWQVGVILLMFGIVVGPVNLFYLAGQGKRHRLFFTTPLISLGAAALVLLVIFMQDGAGGNGRRAALAHLRADGNAVYVKQYQVSRTGVLFSGGFTIPQSAQITPLVLPESRWTRLKRVSYGNNSPSQQFTAGLSGEYGGDYFQSRSEQAQLLEAVQPFRGRLEKRAAAGPGGAPVLVSSLGFPLETLFYQDAAGNWWKAPQKVENGAEIELRASSRTEFDHWTREVMAVFPGYEKERLNESPPPGGFFASATRAGPVLMPTLSSIRWEGDHVILHGPAPEIP